jgi:hypothetical protein
MKLRRSFTFAVALIGGLFAVSAGSSDARVGVEPSVYPQLSFLLSSPASPIPEPVFSSAEPAQKARQCTQDSDCTLHDYYCDGCNCLSLRVGKKPPKCNGVIVQCLVAPCQNKRAACVEGSCVVADGGSAR